MEESLKEAFYGGPILPITTKDLNSGSKNSCSRVFIVLCTILAIIGCLFLTLFFLFRPMSLVVYATDASLTEFNSTHTDDLHYNLVLNLTIRNPNKRLGIYYDHIEVMAFYKGHEFGSVKLQPFYQGVKNTTILDGVALKGLHRLALKDVEELLADKGKGEIYDIDVKVSLKARYKVWIVKSAEISLPRIHCDLKLPFFDTNSEPEFKYDTKVASMHAFQNQRCYLD